MPFKETCPVEERIALFRDYETGVFTVGELCCRHGISRETFYVWKRRRESGQPRWFEDRSHAVERCPHATPDRLAQRIIATRQRFAHFGPKKIKARLEREQPEVDWPAASTIGDILKREGLIEARRRRRRAIAQGEIVAPATAANEEWGIDFKGWFRTQDGTRCDPLTISDAASRYLIEVRIVEPT
jgi:transposase-like protein